MFTESLVKPSFLIIGAARSGTTSLWEYLSSHPKIFLPRKPIPRIMRSLRRSRASPKEPNYFTFNFNKGPEWYSSLFQGKPRKKITGEGSTYYLFHPFAPERISNFLPRVKIIVMLRNPVERAYSQWKFEIEGKREALSFERAIEEEGKRLEKEIKKLRQNPNLNSHAHRFYSYKARGRYKEQLERYLKLFKRERIFIIKSETFFRETKRIYSKVLSFLNLDLIYPREFQIFEKTQKKVMKRETREKLQKYFLPFNLELYSFLKRDFGWD